MGEGNLVCTSINDLSGDLNRTVPAWRGWVGGYVGMSIELSTKHPAHVLTTYQKPRKSIDPTPTTPIILLLKRSSMNSKLLPCSSNFQTKFPPSSRLPLPPIPDNFPILEDENNSVLPPIKQVNKEKYGTLITVHHHNCSKIFNRASYMHDLYPQ